MTAPVRQSLLQLTGAELEQPDLRQCASCSSPFRDWSNWSGAKGRKNVKRTSAD